MTNQLANRSYQRSQAPAKPQISFNDAIKSPDAIATLKKVLPEHIEIDKFIGVCQTAVIQNSLLQNCNPWSIVNAAMKCAEDQLLPDGRQAAFVPFKGQAQYMPMVKGIMKRLKEQGEVTNIHAYCVYENDHFTYALGDSPKIDHAPKALADRGSIVGAYAIFKKGDEILHREVMSLDEINKVREAGGNKKFSPWDSFFDEMARKTVLRRGAKYVIHSDQSNQILERDNVFYDLDKPSLPIAETAPPSVKNINFDEVEKPAETDELEEVDDFLTRDQILAQLKADCEAATNVNELNDAWQLNEPQVKTLPEFDQKEAQEIFESFGEQIAVNA